MAAELTMPKLSDSMAEAIIVRWLKSPGDAFTRGEALIEVETDKATVVYEAESDGTLDTILVPEGGTAAVGQLHRHARETAPARIRADIRTCIRARERPNATPVARRTAVELGVSLHGVAGTGPGGRITRGDVQKAAAAGGAPAQPSAPAAAEGRGDVRAVELTATQATIARRMVESATTVPVFTVSVDIDMSLVAELARRRPGGSGTTCRPSTTSWSRPPPRRCASCRGSTRRTSTDGSSSTRASTSGSRSRSTTRCSSRSSIDADAKTLSEIAAETRRLADAARRRALRPEELRDGTFTVSNLGMFGVRSFTAIVDVPQAAILAVGGVRRAPVEDAGGGVSFRDVMTATLSCDHRVVYGADGARFLSRLRELLERPLLLLA